MRDHRQGPHFLVVLYCKLGESEIMCVKNPAPCSIRDGTVTTQTSFGILLGELSSESVSNSIDGHFFIILP